MTPNKTYFVVCANDGVEYVVEGDKTLATQRMKELKEAHYSRTRGVWANRVEYARRIYWHLREVKGESA